MNLGERPPANPDINTALVRRMIRRQFPRWGHLPITPAVPQGWDNRTFRLGTDMSVRLPSAAGYTPQIEKEHQVLPRLAPLLPLSIPVPLAKGAPGQGFPWSWSIYRWLPGETAVTACIANLTHLATTLARFLVTLESIDATGGPQPGLHSAFRGAPLTTYDTETRRAIHALGNDIDTEAVTQLWNAALAATWNGPPVWFHGDIAVGNLLVSDGELSAVIDFGCSGVGDPACDLVIAWMLFTKDSREAFCSAMSVDDATWMRARGWALWKALITLAEYRRTDPAKAHEAHRVIGEVLADHDRGR